MLGSPFTWCSPVPGQQASIVTLGHGPLCWGSQARSPGCCVFCTLWHRDCTLYWMHKVLLPLNVLSGSLLRREASYDTAQCPGHQRTCSSEAMCHESCLKSTSCRLGLNDYFFKTWYWGLSRWMKKWIQHRRNPLTKEATSNYMNGCFYTENGIIHTENGIFQS